MHRLKFAEIFSSRRKQLGMTQADIAAFVGVSSAAVSKWEQGVSYPELTLLPRLATLLNITIDDLLGYNPQLTREAMNKLYAEFAKRLGSESFEQVQTDIEAMVHEYYACYPFLVMIAQLYLNYYVKAPEPNQVLERVVELCDRAIDHGDDYRLTNEARMIQAYVLLLTGKPQELLTFLGEDVPIQYGSELLIAHAHVALGDQERAKVVVQASMYQYMIILVSTATENLMLEVDHKEHFDASIHRIEGLLQLFGIEALNVNLSLVFYYKAASGYMKQQRKKEALHMLEQYYRTCCKLELPFQLRGDSYFYLIDDWIAKHIQLGSQAPRDEHSIKQGIVSNLLHDPGFADLQEEPAFQAIITNLKHVLQLKEEK